MQGKSFIPLLSAYACAVPAIMSTRTIESRRDRIATILIAPFMTCSARLPVYTLFIAAFIPDGPFLGPVIGRRTAAMLGLYLLGFLAAIMTAKLLKSSVLKSGKSAFVLELPPYRRPNLRTVGLRIYDRAMIFLKRAGTVILGAAVILWILAHVPLVDGVAPGCMIEQPLEAALKALLPSDSPVSFIEGVARGDTDNAGFLREDSILVLVFVTDEDDCSIQDPALLAPDDAGTGPVRPGLDAGPPHIDICSDVEALFPIQRYVDALATIRARRDVVFGFIAGWPELFTTGDVAGTLEASSGGCADSTGWTPAPTRLTELGARFPRNPDT